ncbi:MAG: hypothetical protein PWP76_57 [Candidatus Diapherotrites archaeon]|nr:hypothetical protein [Candidatus Diapherotrites archaeon]
MMKRKKGLKGWKGKAFISGVRFWNVRRLALIMVLVLPLALAARVDPAEYLAKYVYSGGSTEASREDVLKTLQESGDYVNVGNNVLVDKNVLEVLRHVHTDENVPVEVLQELAKMGLKEDVLYKGGEIYKPPGSKLPVGKELQNFYHIIQKYPRLIDTIREMRDVVIGENFTISDSGPVEPVIRWEDLLSRIDTEKEPSPEQIEAVAKVLQDERTREVIKRAAEIASTPEAQEAMRKAVELAKDIKIAKFSPPQRFTGKVPELPRVNVGAQSLPDVGSAGTEAMGIVAVLIVAVLAVMGAGAAIYSTKVFGKRRKESVLDPVARAFWDLVHLVERRTGRRMQPWETIREYLESIGHVVDEEVERAFYGFEAYVYAREKPVGILAWIRAALGRLREGLRRILPFIAVLIIVGTVQAQAVPLVTTYAELAKQGPPRIVALEPESEEPLNEYVLREYGLRNTKLPAFSPDGHPIFPVEIRFNGLPPISLYYNIPTCLVPARTLRGTYSTFLASVGGRRQECIAYFASEDGTIILPDKDAFSEDMLRYFTANALAESVMKYALGIAPLLADAYLNAVMNRILTTVIPIAATVIAIFAMVLALLSALLSATSVQEFRRSELPRGLLPREHRRSEGIRKFIDLSELRRSLLKQVVDRSRIPAQEKYRLMERLNSWKHISKIRAFAVRVKIWLMEMRSSG